MFDPFFKFADYPLWIKGLVVLWGLLTLTILVIVLFTKPVKKSSEQPILSAPPQLQTPNKKLNTTTNSKKIKTASTSKKHSTGLKLQKGEGNTFENITVEGFDKGFDIKDIKNNSFKNMKAITPSKTDENKK